MQAEDRRVDVIVPVYNGEAYLAAALASIAAQTRPPHQLIVVDDGSTDRSAAIARSVAPHARIIGQANQGQAAAVNAALEVATSSYVAFLDADDLWEPEKTERQVDALIADPAAGYSVSQIQNFVTEELREREGSLDPSLLRPKPGYVLSTLLARRSVFERVGHLDVSLSQANKTAWFLRARELDVPAIELDDVLVRRRLHTANLSHTRATPALDEYFGLLKQRITDSRRPELS